jgi:S-formylglutathione hydrolase FrmB
MALLTCDFFSDALQMGTSLTVIWPELTRDSGAGEVTERPADPPLLYLLHGLSDDHSAWLRFTSVARYAEAAGFAVVMPAVGRSFYADERHGHRYWTYLSEELPEILKMVFKLDPPRDRCFAAGLSMGGYGALKLALRQPDRFAAAASMSGALDLVALMQRPDRDEIFQRVFDGHVTPENDLLALLDAGDPLLRPKLWVGCGTEDFLYRDNLGFAAAAEAAGHDLTTDWRPGGHTWDLWDSMLAEVVDWLG